MEEKPQDHHHQEIVLRESSPTRTTIDSIVDRVGPPVLAIFIIADLSNIADARLQPAFAHGRVFRRRADDYFKIGDDEFKPRFVRCPSSAARPIGT